MGSIFDQGLVHFNEVVIDFDLFYQLLPETGHHAKRLNVQPEPFLCELLLDSVLELPKVLNSHAERLLCASLDEQIDKCIVVSLKTDQGLGDLIAVEDELVVHKILHSFDCVVSHLFVYEGRVQQKQSFSWFERRPFSESQIGLGNL
jgi:citrate lyase synthetase